MTLNGDVMNKYDRHMEICKKLNEIYIKKNHDYGDAFSESYGKYGNVMPIIRLEDKLNRFRNLVMNGNVEVKTESMEDTLLDLANYAIMTVIEIESRERNNENN